MPNIVIIGTQWGDEGKGKIVDLLSDDADLVVMGAYGHSRLRELFLGGATRHVLQSDLDVSLLEFPRPAFSDAHDASRPPASSMNFSITTSGFEPPPFDPTAIDPTVLHLHGNNMLERWDGTIRLDTSSQTFEII